MPCCSYEIFKGSEFVKRTKSSTYTFAAGELGNTTLWVHAFDPEGAAVRASMDVWVGPESEDFDADEQIFAMDIPQVVGSNDPSMVARTGSMLGTLTGMSQDKAQGNSQGRRLLEQGDQSAASGAAEDGGTAEMVRVKAAQLLAALTSSATSSIMDAAMMRQVGEAVLSSRGLAK